MRLSTNVILYVVSITALSLSLVPTPRPVSSETVEVTSARVYGSVIDARTKLPIPKASVVFSNGNETFETESDESGSYAMSVAERGSYRVYVYCNPSNLSDFHYIPAYQEIYVQEDICSLSFSLEPGSSIRVQGELRSYKTLQSPKAVYFTVIFRSGLRENATIYDERSVIGHFLTSGDRLLFVPNEIPVMVQADVHYCGETEHYVIDHAGQFFTLGQGIQLEIDLEKQALENWIESCRNYATSTEISVEEMEDTGFYVHYERHEVFRAMRLLDDALSTLAEGAYSESFANLREAYIATRRIEESLPNLRSNAVVSTLFITPFLAFTAMVVGALVSSKRSHRMMTTLLLYLLLILILYLFYPGYTILGVSEAAMLACASLFLACCVTQALPRIFKERTSEYGIAFFSAVVSAFSISARNLRRRRLRTFLTLAPLLISVFAFTALTSLSWEYGFAVGYSRNLPLSGSVDCFIIRRPSEDEIFPSGPVQPAIYKWLKEHPETTLVASKVENIPQVGPFGFIDGPSSHLRFPIYGLVGVVPSVEPNATGIDEMVIQGRFLDDHDLDGMLISEEAARFLGVRICDRLRFLDRNFTLIGIFDSRRFDLLEDIDRNPFPPYMHVELFDGLEPELAPGSETVILHYETAQRQRGTAVSRIFVRTINSNLILPLSRQVVLKWEGVEALAFLSKGIYRLFIGSYHLASGFTTAMVPLAMAALNITVLTRNVVDERKRELMIMSTIGLNPSHITALLLAEALTIGIVGGSVGFLSGLTSYRVMTLLPFPPQVRQKVEPMWGILALFSSITAAVVGSSFPAHKSSVTVTPSKVRRWRIEEKPRGFGDPWVISMPIRLGRENLKDFYTFIGDYLNGYRVGSESIRDVRPVQKGKHHALTRKILFTYFRLENGAVAENTLVSTETLIPNLYVIRLTSTLRGPPNDHELLFRQMASLLRKVVLMYTIIRGRERRTRQRLV